MSKGTAKEKRIIALAYVHRYGWIAVMMICIAIWPKQMVCIFSVGCIAFSIWSLIGKKKKKEVETYFLFFSKCLSSKNDS